jgi:cell division septation protein DedD
MTQTQQQRLLGAGLLLLLICGIALFLLNRVHESHQALNDQEEPLAISSLVEPNNTQVEVFSEPDGEALVDPESLGEAAADQGLQTKLATTPVEKSTAPATQPAPVTAAPTDATTTAEAPAAVKATPAAKPAVAAPNAKSPWIIQLASFSVKSYAEAMVSKLSDLGYSAFIEASKVNDKTIYRVRMYADGDKQAAEKLAQTVGKQLQLKAQVFQN